MTQKPYTIAKLDDGNLEVKFETGEVFTGDALDVTAKLADSRIYARQERDQWRQKAENPPAPPPPTPVQPPVDANEKQLQEYMLDQTAKALGYSSGAEYKADLARVKSGVEQSSQDIAMTRFFTQHPEYPGSKEANDAIGSIMEEMGWEVNDRTLHLAHLEAVDRHRRDPNQGYEVVSEEALKGQTNSRPSAPPMIRGNNPEISTGAPVDYYNMPSAELRKLAIRQELEQRK